ncbi:SPOSA6832_03610, partial [Sporobolomyces salmonicolor]
MPVSQESLEAKIRASWPDLTHVTRDPLIKLVRSSTNSKCLTSQSYEVIIVSPSFEGKTTLKKHREGMSLQADPANKVTRRVDRWSDLAVNEKLKEEIAELHAFTQKTFTPKQFEGVNVVEA